MKKLGIAYNNNIENADKTAQIVKELFEKKGIS